jgi:uncharacterized membrane protein YfcA
VIGLGLPTVAVGLLGLVMSPGEAAALLTIPAIVTNIWQLATGPRFGVLARRLRWLLAGICLGTLVGGFAFGRIAGPDARIALGAALVIYAALGLARLELRVPARLEPSLSPVIGAATGLVTAATGVFVVPAVPYLQALGLAKADLVQALGLSFTLSSLALGAMLLAQGTLGGGAAGTSLFALLPALIGMAIGQWAGARISPGLFRLCFFVGMLALGLDLVR